MSLTFVFRNKISVISRPLFCTVYQRFSTMNLKEILEEKIPVQRSVIKEFRKQHGSDVISGISVDNLYNGLRGCEAMVWETSYLDPEEGIRFRDLTITEIQKLLPTADGGIQPLPEGIFWLLVTGDIPTVDQIRSLSFEWAQRAAVPDYINKMIKAMPKTLHPISQLSCAITALNNESVFAKAYSSGIPKSKYWEAIYEDAMNIIAKIPSIAAQIYKHNYKGKKDKGAVDLDKDWSWNFTQMLGYCNKQFTELMRLYLTLYSDHEGGNVSAHTTNLVGSALSDPYLAWGAGLNGLAGPLHGLANQEALIWLNKIRRELGDSPRDHQIKDFVWQTLKSGKVIPGFGHSVLRKTDPRYFCCRKFALKNLPHDPVFKIISQLYTICPPILQELGKVQNPWPNVDAHSGVLLQYYGMKEINFYTVLFGVARTLGVMASLIWSRALCLPVERPKSLTTEILMKNLKFKLPSSHYQSLQRQKSQTIYN